MTRVFVFLLYPFRLLIAIKSMTDYVGAKLLKNEKKIWMIALGHSCTFF